MIRRCAPEDGKVARHKKAKHPICPVCGREMIWTGGIWFSWYCFVCGQWKTDEVAWPQIREDDKT